MRDAVEVVRVSSWNDWGALCVMACRRTCRVGQMIRSGFAGFVFLVVLFLQVSTFATGSVTLAWNVSPDPIVAGYKIYYGGASGAYTNDIDVGPATNVILTGLVEGATYYFAATTYSVVGVESVFSGEVPWLVPFRVALHSQIVKSNGLPVSLSLSTTGLMTGQWALQSSLDLKTWTTIARGTNLAVSLLVPIRGLSRQFFRLAGR